MSCGLKEEQTGTGLESDWTRHPCYNEQAHLYFARMHLSVAPACNIQCGYCNRKFDCANESRPGVVSELLTPEEAISQTRAAAAQILQLSVVGIAGPGDPLANPKRTFETFAGVRKIDGNLALCLSTNGLEVRRQLDSIQQQGISHVTITINAVDPDIGKHIYSWVRYEGKRLSGREAAAVLIEEQLAGLEALASKGILCKVNSVLIPGVNDDHLAQVSEAVKARGAIMHNIMPLIVAPGSAFEREGMREPTPEELHRVQQQCAAILPVMRHCRQCRADAIGLLGEDRSADFTKEKVASMDIRYDAEAKELFQQSLDAKLKRSGGKACGTSRSGDRELGGQEGALRIAVATRGGGRVNQHFGHAKEFLVYEQRGEPFELLGVRKVQAYCSGRSDCSGEKAAVLNEIATQLQDCSILLSSGIGEEPAKVLRKAGIVPVISKEPIEEALRSAVKYGGYFQLGSMDQPG